VTYRYEQLDGTLALPYKAGGKYHLAGEVKICSWPALRALILTLQPILEQVKGTLVFLSPLPRYLHTGCCADEDHCMKVNTSPYKENLLREVIALQNICKDQLGMMSLGDFLVPDTIKGMMPACTGIGEYCNALKHLSAADGVHFSEEGYRKIGETVLSNIKSHSESAAFPSVPGTSVQSTSGTVRLRTDYYWHGFLSPVGTPRPKNHAAAYKFTHGGGKWLNNKASGGGSAPYIGNRPFGRGSHGGRGGSAGGRGRGKKRGN